MTKTTWSRPTLSVLDLAPVPAGGSAADALRNCLELAQLAERSGYRRFWVAEHHLNPGVAASSTPVLVALVADATHHIRVGSGAVQLPITPPLIVAEQFGTVAALHPGRIDLGLGRFDVHRILATSRQPESGHRAPPRSTSVGDRYVDGLLIPAPGRSNFDPTLFRHLAGMLGIGNGDKAPDYGSQIDAIMSFVRGTARRSEGERLHVLPAEGADLDVWILGSSAGVSAQEAGGHGLPFAVAYHVMPHAVLEAIDAYRIAFRPSDALSRPHIAVSADVVVGPDDDTARELAAPYAEWVLGIRSGRGALPYVTPAEARARNWTDEERATVADRVATQFVGSPATVAGQLEKLARVTGADELVITTITTNHADRMRSFELLAKEWYGR
ncbi:LLM class flavin-dependent oxidoreductase [Pseudonocardia adelaidensis]